MRVWRVLAPRISLAVLLAISRYTEPRVGGVLLCIGLRRNRANDERAHTHVTASSHESAITRAACLFSAIVLDNPPLLQVFILIGIMGVMEKIKGNEDER